MIFNRLCDSPSFTVKLCIITYIYVHTLFIFVHAHVATTSHTHTSSFTCVPRYNRHVEPARFDADANHQRITLATINAHRPNPTVKCHSRNLVLRLSKPKNFPHVVMHVWESHSTQNDRVVSDFVDTCITKRIAGRNCIIRL